MASSKKKVATLSDQGIATVAALLSSLTKLKLEIQSKYSQFQSELQAVASKIGELESEADEHRQAFIQPISIHLLTHIISLVLTTLDEALQEEPDRKCFRLIGGVLVERTVKDVVPALQTNRDGIRTAVKGLADQYTSKEKEFETFKEDYQIRVVGRV
ncbi:Prefoldin beta-like protein [Lentinula boryana]|uniref:Prefoldin beta-like protein n=1 Tax=Lentinula boryana TaxID=40481 RepID=A0ABQ8QAR1_9AGAR|nr:Prefoldin beta-like protein [Lentinula boryana]